MLPSRPPGSKESSHPQLIEMGQLQALSNGPPTNLTQVLQHVPHRLGRVTPLQQPNPVPLDLRP
jgi:hypothetical protein